MTAGGSGRGLTIHVDGLPFENGDRALFVRIETPEIAQTATVVLRFDGAGGATFRGSSR